MPCFALVEEYGFVFFELACGLADSWHVSPPCECFVPESDRREVECVVVIMVVCAVWRHGWFGVRPLGICAIPPVLTVELSKRI